MKNWVSPRFLFTQLSALLVFVGTMSVAGILLVRSLGWSDSLRQRPASGWEVVQIVGAVVGLGAVGLTATVLWGKLLVVVGVLTKEEARGYPYSRPWEDEP